MESELVKFFAGQNIEIALGTCAVQDGLDIPKYDVSLRKGEKEESFIILGDSESDKQITPEDAVRALLIRAQLQENNVELLSGSDMLYRETATRLKELLGPDNYFDFMHLGIVT